MYINFFILKKGLLNHHFKAHQDDCTYKLHIVKFEQNFSS